MIQTRIDTRAVSALQILVGEPPRPAGALGHILAGELDMYPAEIRAQLGMDAEGEIQFLEDVFKPAGLDAAGGGLGVAVHWVAYPQHRLPGLAYRLDRLRQ